MKTITLLITILFMTLPLSAIDKGSWEIYTSYNDITEIEPAGNQVFALASNGLFSYHIKMVQLLHTTKQTLFLTLILIILLGIKYKKVGNHIYQWKY